MIELTNNETYIHKLRLYLMQNNLSCFFDGQNTDRGDYLRQRKKLSVSISIFIAFLIIVTGFLPLKVYSAGSKADIAMEVKAGYDGVARLGAYVPYRILLVNKGRAVEGEVQIEIKIDSQSKTVFAKPVSLAEGATKEIVINAPVFTARRGVQVKLRENGKTIREMEYKFVKLIPPELKTIGVLSSDNAAYNFLNGVLIPMPIDPAYQQKINLMKASGQYSSASSVIAEARKYGTVSKVESILIPLTGENFPEDVKVFNGFDILVIGNFDTGALSENQRNALEKWLESGGTLVIGTGTNCKKVYNSLPETFRKFSVTGTASITPTQELEDFGEAVFPWNINLDIVTGNIGFEFKKAETVINDNENTGTGAENDKGQDQQDQQQKQQTVFSEHANEVIIGDNAKPLAIKYTYQSGRILFLTFDPGMEPFASWDGRLSFWENLLFHSNSTNRIFQRGSEYYYSNPNDIYYLNDITYQVPEDRSPPFLFMFITIAVYIVIAGPAMYIFLKRKDKRDYSWIAVPAVAFLSLVIIYFVGFKTRYRTAVFNTASMITLDMENNKTDIVTGMGIFNNKKGDLKLTYSEEDNIEFDVTQSGSQNYTVYADGEEPEGRVVSKLVLSEPVNYELYDVSMWEPRFLTARKSEPLQDKIVTSVQISDGILRAVINNTTKYDFMEAFITVGSNFIFVGDILSGHQKEIKADLNSENISKSFDAYLDARYGRTSYPSNIKPPEDFPEKRRKRIAIERLLQAQYTTLRGQAKIGLYALNNQNLGYNIKINDEDPVSYFTNGIFASMELDFTKGHEVEIPSGIIIPAIGEYGQVQNSATLDGDNGVMIRDKGDVDFVYTLPKGIQPTEFSLGFDTYVPLYVKYNIEEMKARNNNIQVKILQNTYEYYLYNKSSDSWEKIEDKHTQTADVGRYIDAENKLKVRVKVLEMAETKKSSDEYIEMERLAFPELHLKGVAQ